MILTPCDLAKYAPSVRLEGEALTGLLEYLQTIVESDAGANRSLEITEHTEKITLNFKLQNFWLSYFPLVTPPEPLIKVRMANAQDSFRRGISAFDWIVLNNEQYQIDFDSQVHLQPSAIAQSYGWGRQFIFTEAQVTYSAGIDFTQDTAEVRSLKAACGQILTYMTNNQAYLGISAVNIVGEHSVQYNVTKAGEIPSSLLTPFKKYKIR